MSGAVAGPLAYYGGHRLGAVNFTDMNMALLYLAIGWSIFTPLLLFLAKRLDGYAYLSMPEKEMI